MTSPDDTGARPAGVAGLEWGCVNNGDPRQWALGKRNGAELSPVYAMVTRGVNGRWLWQVCGGPEGVQPSREAAMTAAEAAMQNLTKQKDES